MLQTWMLHTLLLKSFKIFVRNIQLLVKDHAASQGASSIFLRASSYRCSTRFFFESRMRRKKERVVNVVSNVFSLPRKCFLRKGRAWAFCQSGPYNSNDFDHSNQKGSSFLVPQGPFQGLIRVKTSLQSEPSTTISSQSD
jgi:hypothetical protein